MESNQQIDVICQFNKDGSIIPIKIRMEDDNGETQSYVIQGYIEYPPGSGYRIPGGFSATNSIHVFKCKIHSFGHEEILHMFYNTANCQWKLVNSSLNLR